MAKKNCSKTLIHCKKEFSSKEEAEEFGKRLGLLKPEAIFVPNFGKSGGNYFLKEGEGKGHRTQRVKKQ